MTHEQVPNVEGGDYGQDWLQNAASVEPKLLDREIGDAQMPEYDPGEYAAACAEVDAAYPTGWPANG
jgi:hypothetical protein